MRAELRAAINSARTVAREKRRWNFGTVRALVLAVAQELPSEMTAGEIAEELANANVQEGEGIE